MKAVVLRGKSLNIEECPVPEPKAGQVLARVLACGICGSDLHFAKLRGAMNERGIVMGHEFVAEVVKAGPGAENWKPGTRITSIPALPDPDAPNGFYNLDYSTEASGAYAEYLLLGSSLMMPVNDDVPDEVAAMTEPCAVSLHAVREARMQPGQTALIMGAGPIGLLTLLWLKKIGVRHVSVTEPNKERRALAQKLGADLVLNPQTDDVDARVAGALDALPAGNGPNRETPPYGYPPVTRPDVVFECVGAPGTLQQAMNLVNPRGQVIVVGVCMEEDRLSPGLGIIKRLTVRFVLGYDANEFAEALDALSDGSVNAAPLITRSVSLDGLPETFELLSNGTDCKVMVVPYHNH